jgi:hypothetical protein
VKADTSARYVWRASRKKFNVTLNGNNVNAVTGQAKTKTVPELKYTGQSRIATTFPARWTVL